MADAPQVYDAEERARWRAAAARDAELRSEFPEDLKIKFDISSKRGTVAPVSLWWDQIHLPHTLRLVWALDRIAALEAAARDGLEALAAIQDRDDGGLVSPARLTLTKVLSQAEGGAP